MAMQIQAKSEKDASIRGSTQGLIKVGSYIVLYDQEELRA